MKLHDLPKGKRPLTQSKLTNVLVRGRWVNILDEMIHCVLFSTEYRALRLTIEFYYRLGQARTTLILKDSIQNTSLLRWVAGCTAKQGLEPAWVTIYTEPIMKAPLSFLVKFGRRLLDLASGLF